MKRLILLCSFLIFAYGQVDDVSARTVIIRLEPQPVTPNFMKEVQAPHAIPQERKAATPPPPAPTFVPPQAPVQVTNTQTQFPGALPPGVPPAVAQQPTFNGASSQRFVPSNGEQATPPPPPPVNIPADVQNQLIKFFGLDSFGIPGLTGNHPNGFAGAIQELRAAGIPVQGIPAEHLGGQAVRAPESGRIVSHCVLKLIV